MAERSRQRGAWAVVLLCLSLFCWLYPRQVLAAGQEKDEYNGWEDGVIEELLGRDLSGVEGFLQQEAGNTEINGWKWERGRKDDSFRAAGKLDR